MKKIILLICLLSIFSSCEKDLNQKPISDPTTDTFYAIPNDFVQGVNAVYNALRGYPDRILTLSETRSDNLYAISTGGVRDWEGINSFHASLATNPSMTEAWTANYSGIFRANTVLQQLDKNGAIITDATLRSRLEAETKFLRAFFYFDLVRTFGKVPVVDHPLTASEATAISRSPVADVYKLIISDLQFAADNLPEVHATADKGRATKYAAKGMLALVYMTRSGPTYGIEGPGLGLNEWGQALTMLNEIIASGKYAPLTGAGAYANIFSYTNENNAEVIFDIQFNTGSTYLIGSTTNYLGSGFVTQLIPDGYLTSQGKAIAGGGEIRPVSLDLLNSYEAGDVRKAVTVQTGYTLGNVVETRSFFKKYLNIAQAPTNRLDWPINFIVLRYTDVLMLKAECILRGAAGTQAEADAIVSQVRARAGLSGASNVTLAQLFAERRKEFAAEGTRWYDLVRSGQIETTIPAWITAEDVSNPKQMRAFNKNYIIYPVPQTELDTKPGLYTQNAGYN